MKRQEKVTLLTALFFGLTFHLTSGSNANVQSDSHASANALGASDNFTSDESCDSSLHPCRKGVVLPVWEPQLGIDLHDRVARAVIYFVALMYAFLGQSIISDRFMAAIEVITSHERDVEITRPNGQKVIKKVRIWNETVAHLALMALGSSAPECLLSVIEIAGHGMQAGHLGPGAIVGSAAFMLYFVIGVCCLAVPKGESRRVHRKDVFW